MRIYSVHIRRDGLDPDRDIVLVKEGFSWPAAMLMPVWAFWCGLWSVAACMTLMVTGLIAVIIYVEPGGSASTWLFVGTAIISGYVANDLMRASLEKRGFEVRDIVVAPDRDGAEFRFFDRHPDLASGVVGPKGASLL